MSSIEECKARGTFVGPGNVPQQRRETQLYDLVQTEFKSKDCNGRIRKIFVVDFISSMVYGNMYVVKYDGSKKEEKVDEDEMLKKQFGEEWERWRQRVRYRLIPYVY